MKVNDFIAHALKVPKTYKTVYMWGSFGQPVTDGFISQKAKQYPSFYNPNRVRNLKGLVGKSVFAFDCIGLIKGILWGWTGDFSKPRGGAGYAINGVPDLDANMCITKCRDVSTDFSRIVPGEVVWMLGHIGIYIGDGLVVEATTDWSNCVQVTHCANIKSVHGGKNRRWTSHGKLPWVDYTIKEEPKPVLPNAESEDWEVIIRQTQSSPEGWITRINKLINESADPLDKWWPEFIKNLRR